MSSVCDSYRYFTLNFEKKHMYLKQRSIHLYIFIPFLHFYYLYRNVFGIIVHFFFSKQLFHSMLKRITSKISFFARGKKKNLLFEIYIDINIKYITKTFSLTELKHHQLWLLNACIVCEFLDTFFNILFLLFLNVRFFSVFL